MRIDNSPERIRRGTPLQRAVAVIGVLAVGMVLGVGLGSLRRGAPGSLSAAARAVVDGPLDAQLRQLVIDIRFRALQTLQERRQAWRSLGQRQAPEPQSVAAGVRQGNNEAAVALSLLGPANSRAPGELGRLLVDVHGDGDFAGMRSFSLEDLDAPDVVQLLVLSRELARSGGISPRVEAVGLVVNGARWGAALLVEQPSSALLRHAHRPLGALVGWMPLVPPGVDLGASQWLPRPQPAQWSTSARGLQGTPEEAQIAWAQARLDGIRSGQVALEEALDVTATARVLAIAEITGLAERVVQWRDLRWYLHPVSLRLEPVVHLDADAPGPAVRDDTLIPLLLASPAVRAAYASALHAEAQRLTATDAAEHIRKRCAEAWPTMPEAIWARAWSTMRQRAVQALAAEHLPAEQVNPPSGLFLPVPATNAYAALPFATDRAAPAQHALQIPAGTWTIPATVALPDGWSLDIVAGAHLQFGPGAWRVVRGALAIVGRADDPVALTSAGDAPWGGLVVLADDTSSLRHVRFGGANGRGRDVWQPGAALVFVGGKAVLDEVTVHVASDGLSGLRAISTQLTATGLHVHDWPRDNVRLEDTTAHITRLDLAAGNTGLHVLDGDVSLVDARAGALGGQLAWAEGETKLLVRNAHVDGAAALVRVDAGATVRVEGATGRTTVAGFLTHASALSSARIPSLQTTAVTVTAPVLARCSGPAAIHVDGNAHVCIPGGEL